ncbi:hypothetical protein BHE74_00019476, partial [Ensete ventricosum]
HTRTSPSTKLGFLAVPENYALSSRVSLRLPELLFSSTEGPVPSPELQLRSWRGGAPPFRILCAGYSLSRSPVRRR